MKTVEKQRVLDVLNSLEVVESSGGEEAYVLVDNNYENQKLLEEVGISADTVNKYGDEETFCILALAFSEGYADLYDGDKIIAFDKKFEAEVEERKSVVLYKNDNDFYLAISEDGGTVLISKLTKEQLQEIKNVIS